MTLKTLGYSYWKIYKYMNFEILLAVITGIIIGLGTGTITSKIIVNLCEPNYFRFVNTIQPQNYLIAIIVTALFSAIISVNIYFSMKKIDYLRETKNYD